MFLAYTSVSKVLDAHSRKQYLGTFGGPSTGEMKSSNLFSGQETRVLEGIFR